MENKSDKNIVLVGMMGSGKTTVGKALSLKLKRKFYDLDLEVSKAAGYSISEIFDKFGEKYFRIGEEKILARILKTKKNVILSVGGGTFINKNLRKKINESTISIWLNANYNTLHARLKYNHKSRPLFNGYNFEKRLEELINLRENYYKLAHLNVDVNKNMITQITKDIIYKIEKFKND